MNISYCNEEILYAGADYSPSKDNKRLTTQLNRIYECMKDGKWRTLSEIAYITDAPESSVSAQLRNLRKERFGGHTVERKSRGQREKGLFEYQLILNNT